MSVLESDVEFYGSANMPDVDGATTGGALDTTKLIFFNDITPTGTCDYVSSSASDTAAILTATGRDGTGVIQTEAKTLTGTTVVAGAQSFERLLKGVATGTAAVGDVAILSHTKVISAHTAQAGAAASGAVAASITLQAGDGASVAVGQIIRITNNLPVGVNFQLKRIIRISGDIAYVNGAWSTVPTSSSTYDIHQGMLFEKTPNIVKEIRRPFYNVASDFPGGSTRIFYEKIFAVNNNTATALTAALIIKQVDPSSGTLDFALCTALNDTATAANRQTAPTGVGSYSSGVAPQTIAVPAPQNLPSGAAPNAAGAQGVWLRLTLTAGLAAAKTTFTMRATGQTT
ncbi:MAG: hypothetical protein GC190_21970 [Alphaproteobacteria bacterium]|nr:hypothetical protein [Alphaproteobacteria bacterium]